MRTYRVTVSPSVEVLFRELEGQEGVGGIALTVPPSSPLRTADEDDKLPVTDGPSAPTLFAESL